MSDLLQLCLLPRRFLSLSLKFHLQTGHLINFLFTQFESTFEQSFTLAQLFNSEHLWGNLFGQGSFFLDQLFVSTFLLSQRLSTRFVLVSLLTQLSFSVAQGCFQLLHTTRLLLFSIFYLTQFFAHHLQTLFQITFSLFEQLNLGLALTRSLSKLCLQFLPIALQFTNSLSIFNLLPLQLVIFVFCYSELPLTFSSIVA